MAQGDVHRAILAAWRIEQPRLITSLARMLRDVPLAEELTQDALVAALESWPETGVPDHASYVMQQGDIRKIVNKQLSPDDGRC